MSESYLCSCCGLEHSGTPFSFAADFPDNYANMSPAERDTRATIASDQCIIDGKEFWLRGCLEIPIHELSEPFLWGVWANVLESDFDDISANWETEGREHTSGPYKGRLGNSLSLYAQTANLKLRILVRPVGERPLFFIEEPEHSLAREQTQGISLDAARQYSCLLMRMNA
jgi:hypothetical protein